MNLDVPDNLYKKYSYGAWVVRVETKTGEEYDFEIPSLMVRYWPTHQGRIKLAEKKGLKLVKEKFGGNDRALVDVINSWQIVRIPQQLEYSRSPEKEKHDERVITVWSCIISGIWGAILFWGGYFDIKPNWFRWCLFPIFGIPFGYYFYWRAAKQKMGEEGENIVFYFFGFLVCAPFVGLFCSFPVIFIYSIIIRIFK